MQKSFGWLPACLSPHTGTSYRLEDELSCPRHGAGTHKAGSQVCTGRHGAAAEKCQKVQQVCHAADSLIWWEKCFMEVKCEGRREGEGGVAAAVGKPGFPCFCFPVSSRFLPVFLPASPSGQSFVCLSVCLCRPGHSARAAVQQQARQRLPIFRRPCLSLPVPSGMPPAFKQMLTFLHK